MALKGRKYLDRKLIHHSDRGFQYCSNGYIKMLMEYIISISMTENSDPYENAIAERVNGIFKQEFGIGEGFTDFKMAKKEIRNTILIYNTRRPHLSC
jgi:transposase InsO family protein